MSCIWIYFWYIAFIFQPHSSLGLLNTSANINVALNKPSHQSSSVNWLTSPLAVDGKKDTRSGCSQTAKELNPWWSVDLQEVYRIKSVKIYLNKILYTERKVGEIDSRNISIKISKMRILLAWINPVVGHFIWSLSVYVHMKSMSNMIICQHHINSFVHTFLLVDCQGEIGQFVTVKLENMRAILVICEVEVFGEKPFQTFHTDIISRHYCRSNVKPNQVIGALSARSRTECAVFCTQTEKCDAFYFKTNSGQTALCQLKQITWKVLTQNYMEDYNSC